ncbi:alpha/beta fold hydrolase [Streptomyces sp. NBC_00838]|uniref:alpha/beta hydrolase family protein n=1 Tax=Streptomyces sp. NBC_00838 TaxID=2903680 RepID=UPI0038644696|nr:alpha/beta fold hydrolase [Streptomyces sp. NBC_00838]
MIFVHGGGVTREEGGFFTRLATRLGAAGIASLRYDLRGHGMSDGTQEEATLSAHLNDIRVAIDHVRAETAATRVSLIGASFGGGLCAYFSARSHLTTGPLTLLNPQLNYKGRYVDQKPYWSNDHLDDEAAAALAGDGFIPHSPSVKHGRAMLNEIFWISPLDVLSEIVTPTLIIHGTEDTFVPIAASRKAASKITVERELMEIAGAQHGFAVHDDPHYLDRQTQEWQAQVIEKVTQWLRV